MPDLVPLETAQAFRRAAAFLLHWLDPLDQGDGEAAVLAEMGTEGEQVAFCCALARLAWQMARAADDRDTEAAAAYVRSVAADAALDEASVTR